MDIKSERDDRARDELCYRVIATADARALSKLRSALKVIRPLSVLVSPAVSWTEDGREFSFRGLRYRADRQVSRVEIACSERHVDWIMGTVKRVLAESGTALHGHAAVAAFHAGGLGAPE